MLPIHPDEQKKMLISEVENELHKLVRVEDIERIMYYISEVSGHRHHKYFAKTEVTVLVGFKLSRLRLQLNWWFSDAYRAEFVVDVSSSIQGSLRSIPITGKLHTEDVRKPPVNFSPIYASVKRRLVKQ